MVHSPAWVLEGIGSHHVQCSKSTDRPFACQGGSASEVSSHDKCAVLLVLSELSRFHCFYVSSVFGGGSFWLPQLGFTCLVQPGVQNRFVRRVQTKTGLRYCAVVPERLWGSGWSEWPGGARYAGFGVATLPAVPTSHGMRSFSCISAFRRRGERCWHLAGCIFVRPGLPALQHTGSRVKHDGGCSGDESPPQ